MEIAADANEIRHSISSLKRRRRIRIVGLSLLTVFLGFVFLVSLTFMTFKAESPTTIDVPEPVPTATEVPTGVGTETSAPTPLPEPTVPVAYAKSEGLLSPDLILIFSGIGSLLSALATLSNVILSWRKDRREVEEFRRKLAELEMAQARSGGGGS